MHKLQIQNLSVTIGEKEILKDLNLEIKSGEIHVIMGPNGVGKSTLSKVIMGDSSYEIKKGDILFDEKSIISLSTDERARLGIYLTFQNPMEIEGVSNVDFLKAAVSSFQKVNLFQFIKELEEKTNILKMDKEMLNRPVNIGFSGGEKKKNEVLGMYMLKPKVVILDEIDSGLDVDSLKIVGENIMAYYEQEKPAILIITHYQRLLDYIKPQKVHILYQGSIIKSGTSQLVTKIEKQGYLPFVTSHE